jgi:hypothetical protein
MVKVNNEYRMSKFDIRSLKLILPLIRIKGLIGKQLWPLSKGFGVN